MKLENQISVIYNFAYEEIANISQDIFENDSIKLIVILRQYIAAIISNKTILKADSSWMNHYCDWHNLSRASENIRYSSKIK